MADTGESIWIERAQSAEAKLSTMKQNLEPALERVKRFKANFGVKERSDGTIDIDYEVFVTRLGAAACSELRQVMEEMFDLDTSHRSNGVLVVTKPESKRRRLSDVVKY